VTDRLFVSTRKGLFSLVRDGSWWTIERVSFLGDAVSLSLFDARDGSVYAGLGLAHFGVKLRRSVDFGASWQDIAAPAFPKQEGGVVDTLPDGKPWPLRVEQIWALELGASPGELWCGTIGGGLFRSRDAGSSWQLARGLWDHPKRKEWFGGGSDLPGIHSVCVHPDDPRVVVTGVSCGGVWRSGDGGETWGLSSKGMFADYMPPQRREDEAVQDPHRIVQCRSKPDRLWAQHHNGVFRSDDGGRNWTSLSNVPPSVFGFAVAVHPSDPDTAWLVPATKDEQRIPVGGRVVVARTRDGGKTWKELCRGLPQTHAYDIVYRHALDVDASGSVLAMGSTTGSLWTTDDAGDVWTCVSNHLPPIYAVRFASS
jgi:hypothetical protein